MAGLLEIAELIMEAIMGKSLDGIFFSKSWSWLPESNSIHEWNICENMG